MKYREAARRLTDPGCQELPRRGGGSHRKWFNPATGQGTVLPDHGGKHPKSSTLHSALKQLGIEWQDFVDA